MERIKNSCVAVIIPTLNEEENIAEVIHELKHLGFLNLLIIDGNSRDRTVTIAKKLGVKVIHQNGHGKGTALRQAFSYNRQNGNHDVVVIMDADGSMNPKELFPLIEALNGRVDLVKASRFMFGGHSEDMSLVRRIGNTLFVLLVNSFWSANYTDLCYGFAAFSKGAVEKLYPRLKSTNFEIETEMFIKAKKLKLTVVEVPSVELRRKYGKSNLNAFKDGFQIFKTIIREYIHPNE